MAFSPSGGRARQFALELDARCRNLPDVFRFCLALLTGIFPLRSLAAEPDWLAWASADLRQADRELATARDQLAELGEPSIGNTVPQLGYQHLQVAVPPPESWLQVDLGSSQPLDTIALVPALVDFQTRAREAYGFPRRFRLDVSDDPTFARFTPLLVHTTEDFPAADVVPVIIPAHGVPARYVRLTVTRMAEVNDMHFFALAELMALRGNRNVALGAAVTASNTVNILGRWNLAYLTDGRTPLGFPIEQTRRPDYHEALTATEAADGIWMAVDLGAVRLLDEVRLHPLHSWQGADVAGYAFPLQFRVEGATRADFADAQVIFTTHGEDFPNPGNNPVTLDATGRRARFIKLTAEVVPPPTLNYPTPPRFILSELEVQADGAMASRGCPVTSSGDRSHFPPRSTSLLTDGNTSRGRIIELPVWLEQWARRTRLEAAVRSLEIRVGQLRGAVQRRLVWAGGIAVLGLAAGAMLLVVRGQRERTAFRNRLAQDLHDEIGSNLAGIAVLAETGAMRAEGDAGVLAEINRVARETADAMREVLWLVGSRQEGGIDLAKHFRLVATRLLPRAEVVWTAIPETFPATWPAGMRREIFLFFKEALTNIARHARPTRVELAATLEDARFELSLRDNGRGFDPAAARHGLGLGGLQARARTLGGRLEITSAPGEGTLVVLRIPVPKPTS